MKGPRSRLLARLTRPSQSLTDRMLVRRARDGPIESRSPDRDPGERPSEGALSSASMPNRLAERKPGARTP
jgi:hypothetical protein